jgi:hypothetical protein
MERENEQVIQQLQAELAAVTMAVAVLSNLYDEQNGAPLIMDAPDWNNAMERETGQVTPTLARLRKQVDDGYPLCLNNADGAALLAIAEAAQEALMHIDPDSITHDKLRAALSALEVPPC